MILDPVNSVSSLDFYRTVSGQSPLRSLLYVCYLSALFAVCCTFALKVKLGPMIDETFTWLEKSVPPMTYANGKVSSPLAAPTRLQHPRVPEVAVMIDTTRVEPLKPEELTEQKVIAYLTSTTFYVRHQSGRVDVYDLSKAPAQQPVQIDGSFFKAANTVMSRVLYPIALAITFLLFLTWKIVTSLVYSVLALIINAIQKTPLTYGELFNVAVYAQTLVVGLQAISLFLPSAIPGFPLIALSVTAAYIWLALKRHSSDSFSSPQAA